MSEITGKIGQVLAGRYRLVALLGRGGMGSVWRAEHLSLGTPVAVKLIHPSLAERPGMLSRFLREAQAAARLRSVNVVQILDHGVDDGVPYIAMECLDGESLADRLARERRLGPAATALVMTGVCRALAGAHRAGIVHRDLKPDNIFIARDEAGPIVKVLDFGIAKMIEGEIDPTASTMTTDRTETGAMLGTPRYMSPEQARGRTDLDGRSDLWSLSVIAFQCLTGRVPFDAETVGSLVLQICTEPAPFPSSMGEVPRGFDGWFARATEREPAARFQTVRDFADALAEILTPGRRWLEAGDDRAPNAREEAPAGRVDDATTRTGTLTAKPTGGAPPRRSRSRVILGVALSLAAAVAVAGFFSRWSAHRGETGHGPVSSSSAPAPGASAGQPPKAATLFGVAVDELVAGTNNAEARAALLSALQMMRDGRGDNWGALDKAASLDPTYGAPELWHAAMIVSGDLFIARKAMEKAYPLRLGMSRSNQALLAALAPCCQTDPPDLAACEAKLAAASALEPNNAYLHYLRGVIPFEIDGPSESHAAHFDKAAELDPDFPRPMVVKAQELAYLGRFEEAKRLLEQQTPSTGGLLNLALIHEAEGRCDAVEADARRMQVFSSTDPRAFIILANVAITKGASADVVDELHSQATKDLTDQVLRGKFETSSQVWSAYNRGDFVVALRHLDRLDSLWVGAADQSSHMNQYAFRAGIARESGDLAGAGRVAQEALRMQSAWLPPPRIDDFAISRDRTPLLLHLAYLAGRLSREAYAQKRDDWLRAWSAKMPPFMTRYLWLAAYAAQVETEEDAREALAAMPATGIPPFRPTYHVDHGIGLMYLLLERVDEALPYLRSGAESCMVMDHSPDPSSWLHYGRGLEKKGDKEGACRAYARVLDVWGHAKPRSVTADDARARARGLRCELH